MIWMVRKCRAVEAGVETCGEGKRSVAGGANEDRGGGEGEGEEEENRDGRAAALKAISA
jgi:hypothetical protein